MNTHETQMTLSWKFRFLWVFCMHFGVLVPNKMKYTQNTRSWYCCSVSPYKITKKLFSVLVLANEKKKKNYVSRNVIVSPYRVLCKHFNVFLVFLRNKPNTLKILVFSYVIMFQHKG